MRIVELPFELCGGRVPALAFLSEREDQLQVALQLWLGNGTPAGVPVACTITLPDYVDDTLAIKVNGVWVKDDSLGLGGDNLEHDLFALAAAVPLVLNAGDRVELFAKDTLGVYITTQPWVAVITFDDGSTRTISGGALETEVPSGTPSYMEMGAFTLGWPVAAQATSYFQLASINRFATPATLQQQYNADAPTLDENGPLILLTGVDNELDDADAFRAMAAESLIFINDEIMTLAGAELVAANLYRLNVLRQRFGTRKVTHASGSEVWLIARADLQPITHPSFIVGNSYTVKAVRIGSRFSSSLAEVYPVSHTFTGQPFVPSPRNLRANGEAAPSFAAAVLELTWSLPENIDRTGEGDFTYASRIRFYVDDELQDERTAHTASVTYTAAEITAFLGGGAEVRIEVATVATSEEIQLASAAETLTGEVI
jgi:hypothetical protein